jgi:hypothetical protein
MKICNIRDTKLSRILKEFRVCSIDKSFDVPFNNRATIALKNSKYEYEFDISYRGLFESSDMLSILIDFREAAKQAETLGEECFTKFIPTKYVKFLLCRRTYV